MYRTALVLLLVTAALCAAGEGLAQSPDSVVEAPEQPLALPSSWRPSSRYPYAAPLSTDTRSAVGRSPKRVTGTPRWSRVSTYAGAYGPPATAWSYRPYYSRWGQHPYRRYRYATAPSQGSASGSGFREVAGPDGRMLREPDFPPPSGYVWEAGFWHGEVYVEGFFRRSYREDGAWTWVPARRGPQGYIAGFWRPEQSVTGYTWEPGFFDGMDWVAGYWRPASRSGFTWSVTRRTAEGLETGYWVPTERREGQVWVPGWFDGTQWVPGLWVDEASYREAEAIGWRPLEESQPAAPPDDSRLAVPVESR